MRSVTIFAIDVIASLAVVAWCRSGLWIQWYGFAGRHPESALEYFQGLVCAGSLTFAALFILTSGILLLWARRLAASAEGTGLLRLMYRAFYDDLRSLLVKYFVFCGVILVCPAFYFYMWGLHEPRAIRIAGGFTMTVLVFVGLVVALDWSVARRAPQSADAIA